MTPAEFEGWIEFYRLYPFDDFHRFYRPAAMVAGAFGGGDMQGRLDWLQPPPSTGHTGADLDLFKAAGFTPPRKTT